MLPYEDVRTMQLLFERGDVVVFVSGMQGLTVIMSMEEVLDLTLGESSLMPVYTLVELATPMDFFMQKVTIPN